MKNKFDTVMNYIDAHINENTEDIKKGIYQEISYNSSHFGKCFEVLTGETLFHYINERKLYFAAQELVQNPKKSICEISLDLGYSDQSAFTRAMRTYHNCTPGEIRKRTKSVQNNKYQLSFFCERKSKSRADAYWCELEEDGSLSGKKFDYLMEIEDAKEEYGFDVDTSYAIIDLAEQLEIPAYILMKECFQLLVDFRSDPDYISPYVEAAIDAGVESTTEMEKICEFFQCKYYDVDSFMVDAYRKQNNQE